MKKLLLTGLVTVMTASLTHGANDSAQLTLSATYPESVSVEYVDDQGSSLTQKSVGDLTQLQADTAIGSIKINSNTTFKLAFTTDSSTNGNFLRSGAADQGSENVFPYTLSMQEQSGGSTLGATSATDFSSAQAVNFASDINFNQSLTAVTADKLFDLFISPATGAQNTTRIAGDYASVLTVTITSI